MAVDVPVRPGHGLPSRLPAAAGWGRSVTGPAAWALLVAVLVAPMLSFLLVAVSPRLFAQGPQWWTTGPFVQAFRGSFGRALLDTALIGVAAAVLAAVLAIGLALLIHRTSLAGRPVWTLLIWALLLTPSYLQALGWVRLVEPDGVLARLTGTDPMWLRGVVLGPVGITWVLGSRGVPFAYLAVSAALAGLGREYEDAARTHGADWWTTVRVVLSLLAPAVWAGLAIVFAESVSDYGVASTLAATANFPVATFAVFQAVSTFPANFPVAAAVGWLLLGLVAAALAIQHRAQRGRSYALAAGRSRRTHRVGLRPVEQGVALGAVAGFFGLAIGVPLLGAVLASMLTPTGQLTLANYARVLTRPGGRAPVELSAGLAAITASVVVVLGVAVARTLNRRTGRAGRLLDLALLGAVAIPSIVLGAGYIFTFNLPALADTGLPLYGTLNVLVLGYVAGGLPATARLLAGPVSQQRASILSAARVHGARPLRAWLRCGLPPLAPTLLWGWLLAFAGTLLELPLSAMLAPPGAEPLSVAITRRLEGYDVAGGSALMVLAAFGALGLIAIALALFRLLAPAGWRHLEAR